MAMMEWDAAGTRSFEHGIDRGVLYFPEGGAVPWNGLISVVENASTTAESVSFDGRKINDITRTTSFSGRLTAFTYPEEFQEYEGIAEEDLGLQFAEQPLKRFHLAYRTKVGNDQDPDAGYKIHILYDLTAIPTTRDYKTLSLDVEPVEFQWNITAIPQEVSGRRPTPHLIIDTRKVEPWVLDDIEEILYGGVDSNPLLPSMESFTAFIRGYDRIVVFDNGDGTYTISTTRTDAIIDNGDGTFTVNDANATFPDGDTFEISSTDKEALWLQ